MEAVDGFDLRLVSAERAYEFLHRHLILQNKIKSVRLSRRSNSAVQGVDMKSSLSEGYVFLTRNFNGPGVLVHTAIEDEYVTLMAAPVQDMDGDFVARNDNQQTKVRINVGRCAMALHLSVLSDGVKVIAPNLPVLVGDELWVACSAPNEFLIYGFTSKRPA